MMAETLALTPREQQVAHLAARGFSTKYIAAKLFLSSRTVEVHIRHVYEKLSIRSRDELIERGAWRL